MAMREDCVHYESRSYETGEVARFCTKDLAPEAPWRCPEACPGYERIQMIDRDFDAGSLAAIPPVEAEPDAPVDDIVGVLDDAEAIVAAAAPEVIADLDRERPAKKGPWWRRRKRRGGDDGDDFRLSSR